MIAYEVINGVPEEDVIREISILESGIFANRAHDFDRLKYEFQNKNNLLTILARDGKTPVGFKIGYERRSEQFYSWMGGVSPEYRHRSIASGLMSKQHEWLKKNGYERVRTQTGNEYRDMLSLNIKLGFDVVGTFLNRKGKIRIILEKAL